MWVSFILLQNLLKVARVSLPIPPLYITHCCIIYEARGSIEWGSQQGITASVTNLKPPKCDSLLWRQVTWCLPNSLGTLFSRILEKKTLFSFSYFRTGMSPSIPFHLFSSATSGDHDTEETKEHMWRDELGRGLYKVQAAEGDREH